MSFTLHKPRKDGSGCASTWEYRKDFRPGKEGDWLFFVKFAKQLPKDENGNDRFDWKGEGNLTMKLGENDLGELLATFNKRQTNTKLFHEFGDGNTAVELAPGTGDRGGFLLSVSKKANKETAPVRFSHSISNGETEVLKLLFDSYLRKVLGPKEFKKENHGTTN